jgi:hypothetical protein
MNLSMAGFAPCRADQKKANTASTVAIAQERWCVGRTAAFVNVSTIVIVLARSVMPMGNVSAQVAVVVVAAAA